jgi:uncharacterized repeat protein (TIGR03803 family)
LTGKNTSNHAQLDPGGPRNAADLRDLACVTALISNTNSDGALPHAGLIVLSGNTLYGAAERGGGAPNGVVFKVNTNGTGLTTLSFNNVLLSRFPLPSHYSPTIFDFAVALNSVPV